VADADETIREAQYAFHNISPGSADERKYRARAKKFAKRVIRKYPASIEASRARAILDALDVSYDFPESGAKQGPRQEAVTFLKDHSATTGHGANSTHTRSPQALGTGEWRTLMQRFSELPKNKKKYLAIGLFVVFVFPGGIFFLGGLAVLYALRPALLKKHLDHLLWTLGSE
jgi:hypothetical protein